MVVAEGSPNAVAGTLWAVIPVKSLASAKGRLSRVLGPSQRRLLVLAMLRDELTVLRGNEQVFLELTLGARP